MSTSDHTQITEYSRPASNSYQNDRDTHNPLTPVGEHEVAFEGLAEGEDTMGALARVFLAAYRGAPPDPVDLVRIGFPIPDTAAR
jgi:hypothetical protein